MWQVVQVYNMDYILSSQKGRSWKKSKGKLPEYHKLFLKPSAADLLLTLWFGTHRDTTWELFGTKIPGHLSDMLNQS